MERMAISVERLALIKARDGRTHVTLQGRSLCSPEMLLDAPVIVCGPDAVDQASCPKCKKAGKLVLCADHVDHANTDDQKPETKILPNSDNANYHLFWALIWLGVFFSLFGWTRFAAVAIIWACVRRLTFLYRRHRLTQKLHKSQ